MKKLVYIAIFCALVGCLQNQTPINKNLKDSTLPSFNILLLDSITYFNTSSIPIGKPIILVFISSTCPYCRALTKEIVQKMKELKDIQFLILSGDSIKSLKMYLHYFQLSQYSNIIIGQDYTKYFPSHFNATNIPFVVIYNREKRLKQIRVGQTEVMAMKEIALK